LIFLRRRAVLVLWTEQLLAASAPVAAILLAYTITALFGFGTAWACAGAITAAVLALAWGAARIKRPAAREIDHRIEAASGFAHRPLAALQDRPDTNDPTALALWHAHQTRLEKQLDQVRSFLPALNTAARDPFALRAFLLLLLLTGIIIAGPAAPSRLAAGFALPPWPFPGPSLNIWITPPAFTGAPPHLLAPAEHVTTFPGAKLTLVIDGPRRAPVLSLGRTGFSWQDLAANSHRADATLTASAVLQVGPWWHRLGTWPITVVPPAAPVILPGGMTIVDNTHLTLHWQVQDPYGLATFSVRAQPVGPADALGETFPLPLSTQAKSATIDLSNAPFTGLPFTITFTARNLAGVSATAKPHLTLTLAAPDLHDKTARVLQKIRQNLALYPGQAAFIGQTIRHISAGPPSAITDSADLKLAYLGGSMARDFVTAIDASQILGALIKEIEAGPDYAPSQALAASDKALMDALQRGLNGQPPSAAALQQLLQAMQQALAQHLGAIRPPPPNGAPMRPFDMSALNKLAQQIAADEAAGNTAKAAQEMRQMQAALNALQNAQPMTAAQAAQAQAADQAAQGLSQLTNEEAGLLNNTQQGNAAPADQAGLQSALDAIKKGLQQSGIGTLPGLSQALGKAGQAMQDAQNGLAGQDNAGAVKSETAAIQALQQAAAALQAGRQQGMSLGGGGQTMPGDATSGEGVNGLPDEDPIPGFGLPANPADAIQQQIIKQDAAPNLPTSIHQYYHRLLDPDQQ
jgi:hypothetical protein